MTMPIKVSWTKWTIIPLFNSNGSSVGVAVCLCGTWLASCINAVLWSWRVNELWTVPKKIFMNAWCRATQLQDGTLARAQLTVLLFHQMACIWQQLAGMVCLFHFYYLLKLLGSSIITWFPAHLGILNFLLSGVSFTRKLLHLTDQFQILRNNDS